MNRSVIAGAAVLAVLGSAVAGYRFGAGAWPIPAHLLHGTAAGRTVLYWKDPEGKNDFSPGPKKTADGRDYIPVYEEQEAGFKQVKPAKQQSPWQSDLSPAVSFETLDCPRRRKALRLLHFDTGLQRQ